MFIMPSDTFRKLYQTIDKDLIPKTKFYSAHKKGNEFELLEDHSHLCVKYFLYLVERLELESILETMLSDLFGEECLTNSKQIILTAFYYHDIGKTNPKFQEKKVRKRNIAGNTVHSFFSEGILISFLLEKFPNLKTLIYLLTVIVSKHHVRLGNFATGDYLESLEEREILDEIYKEVMIEEKIISEDEKKEFFSTDFEWHKIFFLVKLLYSLLVMSDSYSTIHYEYSLNSMYPLNTLNDEIKERMNNAFSRIPYNTNIDTSDSRDISVLDNLNDLRREILIEADQQIKKILQEKKKIFMLSVPTGGGKTNISMKLALNILTYDEQIKRVFFVFPYINIIEQNYDAINRTLFDETLFPDKTGLCSDIYSKTYVTKFQVSDEEDSASFVRKMLTIKDDNFLNNCVNVTTSVNFFNGIIKNRGNNRYKLANLCNSIVIIDEIQTLSDTNLRTFYKFIEETSKTLNIYYIIMSATLPDFNDFLEDVEVPQVIDKPEKYFTHKVFKRNEIVFKKEVQNIDGIKDILITEINDKYQDGSLKILVTLNTVDTSRRVYENLQDDKNFDDFTFYLLNSTISSLRRKKIIEEIKDKTEKKRIIIVSTQSVEAGVDIDCDFGIRDYAILDSIEQISGRVNRECDPKKANSSKLFVIKYKDGKLPDCKKIYARQERFKIQVIEFTQRELEKILESKQFDRYYQTLSRRLKQVGKDFYGIHESIVRNLHYKELNDKLDVIDDKIDKLDIFICESIPLKQLSKYDHDHIKAILSDPTIQKFEKDHRIISGEMIHTKNIYKAWKMILKSTDKFKDVYLRRKITSLFNQFLISITNIKNTRYEKDLLEYLLSEELAELEEEFNVILSKPRFGKYYRFRDGLSSEKLKEEIKNISSCVFI